MKLRNLFIILLSSYLFACGGENSGAPSQGGGDSHWSPPIAQAVKIQGDVFSGKKINGGYTYFDPNANARLEGSSIFRWKIDSVVQNSKSISFDLLSKHIGKKVSFCVTPVAVGIINFTGNEICSVPVVVNPPSSNVVPEAFNVTINPEINLITGDRISSSYVYYDQDNDMELNSNLSWFLDDILVQTGGDKFDLLADSENKTLKFCVIPISNISPTIGNKVCTQSDQIQAKVGTAPVANNVSIIGAITSGSNLVGSYVYTDIDNDLEGATLFSWKSAGVNISGASISTYTPLVADEGKSLSFCVIPVAKTGDPKMGAEVCHDAGIVSPPLGFSPTATTLIDTTNPPLPLTFLKGKYTYIPGIDAVSEGSTSITWNIDGVDSGVTCIPSVSCSYEIKERDAGKTIQFCVIPVNANGASGPQVCDDIVGASVKYSGNLNYFENINVTLQGYSNNLETSWGITSRYGIQDLQTTGLTYKIEYSSSIFSKTYLLSRNMIGEDLEFCVKDLDKGYAKYCSRVSKDLSNQYLAVSDGTFVGGGIEINYMPFVGIAPATVYNDVTTGLKFMRPLTPKESAFVGVTADAPQVDNRLITSHYVLDNARTLCSLLAADGGGWRLPTFDELRDFNTNLSTYDKLLNYAGVLDPLKDPLTYELGWHGLYNPYWAIGFSLRASDGRIYRVNPYNEGEGTISNPDTKTVPVTCVK